MRRPGWGIDPPSTSTTRVEPVPADISIHMRDTGDQDADAVWDLLSPTVTPNSLGLQVSDVTNNTGEEIIYVFLTVPFTGDRAALEQTLAALAGVVDVEFGVVPRGVFPVR